MKFNVFINYKNNIKLPFFINKVINVYPSTIEINSYGNFKSTIINYNYKTYEFKSNICTIRFKTLYDFKKAKNIVNSDCYMLSNDI